MKLAESQVRDSIRRWYASRWFAPNRLKDAALTDTAKGLYIPYWTFDAQVHADWTAESGYYYYVTETYTDANGRTQTRQVQKVRWVPSSGPRSFLRQRTGAGLPRRPSRNVAPDRAVSRPRN